MSWWALPPADTGKVTEQYTPPLHTSIALSDHPHSLEASLPGTSSSSHPLAFSMSIWSHILTSLTCFFLSFFSKHHHSFPVDTMHSVRKQPTFPATCSPAAMLYMLLLSTRSGTWSLEHPIPLSLLLSLSNSLICICSLFCRMFISILRQIFYKV